MVVSSANTQSFVKLIEYLNCDAIDSDRLLIYGDISWNTYENLLDYLGNSPYFKVVYHQGILQIMSPSSRHEIYKKTLGMLVENYCLETGIYFYPLGSTTLKSQDKLKGLEPDQCYCIGSKKKIPDLAIEVVITSGGIKTLEIYKGLGVSEVWFWQNGELQVFCLENGEYLQKNNSQLLPKIDLELLVSYLDWDEPFDAILDFKAKIRSKKEERSIK
ncbi:Uma2 family endonuclease [Okeania sp.]|uniref:Uma2 family endonuclease n=1 Tax=Okeania sp. TaxID=3100323 RepID=UPI002B4B81E0|nr:Uma2 family endonuclease [Okeania sp.]MEB3342186.1 Uma2 family endonuclease [Okeania sp.]